MFRSFHVTIITSEYITFRSEPISYRSERFKPFEIEYHELVISFSWPFTNEKNGANQVYLFEAPI